MADITKLIASNYIEEMVRTFDAEHKHEEEALSLIFTTFKDNKVYEIVLLKVITLNQLYSTRIRDKDVKILVERILVQEDLDKLIEEGNIQAVTRIGKKQDALNNVFVFASKYCSFHNANSFPIYDSKSRIALFALNQEYGFSTIKNKTSLENYDTYKKVIDDFKAALDDNYNYKQLDKFLWMLGKYPDKYWHLMG